jgi:hypothetical protein
MSSHDIILPPAALPADVAQSKFAAFVPIALALVGVAAIILGGVSARTDGAVASVSPVDTVVTGSIAAPADLSVMELLDR